jgi:hypothetical protein
MNKLFEFHWKFAPEKQEKTCLLCINGRKETEISSPDRLHDDELEGRLVARWITSEFQDNLKIFAHRARKHSFYDSLLGKTTPLESIKDKVVRKETIFDGMHAIWKDKTKTEVDRVEVLYHFSSFIDIMITIGLDMHPIYATRKHKVYLMDSFQDNYIEIINNAKNQQQIACEIISDLVNSGRRNRVRLLLKQLSKILSEKAIRSIEASIAQIGRAHV